MKMPAHAAVRGRASLRTRPARVGHHLAVVHPEVGVEDGEARTDHGAIIDLKHQAQARG